LEDIDGIFSIQNEKDRQLDDLEEENLVDLAEGKKIGGLKLTKAQRREIKHSIKRGEDVDILGFLKQA
jgi:large subunit GTPase 1